jgi:hypothetical protein
MNLANIEAALREKRTELETTLEVIASAIAALEGSKRVKHNPGGRKRHLSTAGRKAIIAAQKARWARYKMKSRVKA